MRGGPRLQGLLLAMGGIVVVLGLVRMAAYTAGSSPGPGPSGPSLQGPLGDDRSLPSGTPDEPRPPPGWERWLPQDLLPRSVRVRLSDWWGKHEGAILELAVVLESERPGDEEELMLRALAALMPTVRSTVFTESAAVMRMAKKLGVASAHIGERTPRGAVSVHGIFEFIRQSHVEQPLFYGMMAPGSVFPDPRALVDTLTGIAADVREDRIPPDVVLLGRSRMTKSFADAELLVHSLMTAKHGSDDWMSLDSQVEELEFEPLASHAFCFFTAEAVDWSAPLAKHMSSPSHIVSLAISQHRLAFADEAQGAGAGLGLDAASLLRGADTKTGAGSSNSNGGTIGTQGVGDLAAIDITETTHVMRWPWAGTAAESPVLRDLSGRLLKPITADDAVLGTAEESPGHVVVGLRGAAEEIQEPDPVMMQPQPQTKPPVAPPPAQSSSSTSNAGQLRSSPSPSPSSDASLPPAPVLTVFTTLFAKDLKDPFGLQKFLIQKNTLLALKALSPAVEPIVFSKDKQILDLCEKIGVQCVTEFALNRHGTPFLKSMFQWVEDHSRAALFGYCNGDILFNSGLVHSARAVLEAIEDHRVHRRVLIIGRRTNFQMPFPLAEDSKWMIRGRDSVDKTVRDMAVRGRLFQLDAEDFFFITKGTFDWAKMPDFVIGRVAYDNWLVDHAFHDGIDRVDVTATVHAVHQTGKDGNKAGHIPRPDKEWNKELVSKSGRGGYDHGMTIHSNWASKFQTTSAGAKVTLVVQSKWHSPNRPKDLLSS